MGRVYPPLTPPTDHFWDHILTTFSSLGPCFARKYVYILRGTLKNTCVFATYAHWYVKTLEKTRENRARVHSSHFGPHLCAQKHCAGALKVTLGSLVHPKVSATRSHIPWEHVFHPPRDSQVPPKATHQLLLDFPDLGISRRFSLSP